MDLEPCARVGDDVALFGCARLPKARHSDNADADQRIQMALLEMLPFSDNEIRHDLRQVTWHVTGLQDISLLLRQFALAYALLWTEIHDVNVDQRTLHLR